MQSGAGGKRLISRLGGKSLHSNADLLEIIDALRPPRRFTGRLNSRHY
jgi:hypothetical protein